MTVGSPLRILFIAFLRGALNMSLLNYENLAHTSSAFWSLCALISSFYILTLFASSSLMSFFTSTIENKPLIIYILILTLSLPVFNVMDAKGDVRVWKVSAFWQHVLFIQFFEHFFSTISHQLVKTIAIKTKFE